MRRGLFDISAGPIHGRARLAGRRPVLILAILAMLALPGCKSVLEGAAEGLAESKLVDFLGLGPSLPCELSPREGRRMTGAFLRTPVAAPGAEALYVTGRPSRVPLPRNISVDETGIRRISPEDDGRLEGSRRSELVPVSGFGSAERLPAAYDVRYRAEKVDFAGALVLGLSPTAIEIPGQGNLTAEGPIRVLWSVVGPDGAVRVSEARGRFRAAVGFGSGRTEFSAWGFSTLSGPAIPFASLRWTRLGLCGPRVVSSGQGLLTLFDGAGKRVPLFGADAAPGSSIFESSLFARELRPGPPTGLGGVLAVTGDTGTLTGVFLAGAATADAEATASTGEAPAGKGQGLPDLSRIVELPEIDLPEPPNVDLR
jgi:hypothetical protein